MSYAVVSSAGTKRFDSEKAGDREVQRTMLELLNQLDGFMPNSDIKVHPFHAKLCPHHSHDEHVLDVTPLFLRFVPSSGVAALVIDGSLPSYSVIRHLSFQFHHFHVSVPSFHPPCPRSSYFSGCLMSIICLQTCSSGRLVTCPNHFIVFLSLPDIIATPTASLVYSFLILSFRITPHLF